MAQPHATRDTAVRDTDRELHFHELFRRNLPREHGFERLEVEGTLPDDLRGTLYRNGPGLFEMFGRRYDHIFEGDGAVDAVRFAGGEAHGAARITETSGLVAERDAGRVLYGLQLPWWKRMWNTHVRRRIKNTANTNIVAWQGRLFALMEAAGPVEIAPGDLATIGDTDLGGVVTGAFSAHPHRVPSRKAIYNYGVRYGRKTYLDLYELPDAGAARKLGAVEIAGPAMVHDYMATGDHLVFFVPPAWVDLPNVFLQRGTFTDLFTWRPEKGTQIVVVPIDRPREPITFTVDPFYQWHFANGFERDGELVIDLVRYPDFSSFDALETTSEADIPPGTLHRVTVDPARRTLRDEPLDDRPTEFPRVHPDREAGRHRYIWNVVDGGRGIGCFDVDDGTHEVLELPSGQLASEAVLAPRPGATGERDAYLLSLLYDRSRDRSGVAVYDAARHTGGPLGVAWFDHFIPVTFHGNWVAA